ncbi:MAG: hypothetical protein LBC07_04960 [Elusimicrobiota bacterium]|nr:hypothetical protein [Elusimicrobiota bacterium]
MTDSSLFCHARLGEGKGNFQFPLPSWRKKFLVKTKRFAAFARLKNKKSAGDSTTRQKQKHSNNKDNDKTKKFLVKQALTLRYAAKPKERGERYDTTKTKKHNKKRSEKFLVKTKRFAAYARLKNKKSAGEGTTQQKQQQRQNKKILA